MLRVPSFLLCLFAAPGVWAHPHVFVDVTLRLEADDKDRIKAIEVTWIYDTLFSLLVLSDRGLDPDADLMLTEDEKAQLLGFDLQGWPEGFEGALFAAVEGEAVPLGPAEPLSVGMRDGALVTRHRRPLGPLELGVGEALRLQPFDPYYYAALSLQGMKGVPEGCAARIMSPDKDQADARVAELGNTENESFFEEAKVGVYYAFTVEVTCAGS